MVVNTPTTSEKQERLAAADEHMRQVKTERGNVLTNAYIKQVSIYKYSKAVDVSTETIVRMSKGKLALYMCFPTLGMLLVSAVSYFEGIYVPLFFQGPVMLVIAYFIFRMYMRRVVLSAEGMHVNKHDTVALNNILTCYTLQ